MEKMDPASKENLSLLTSPVSETESGQKLLRFLERRLGLPASLLHRWVRTGQIRINGKRSKPFERIKSGDIVRIPPFAEKLASEVSGHGDVNANVQTGIAASEKNVCGNPPLPLLECWHDILAINKPAGLPVQAGTGHEDCVCARLVRCDSFFNPAPAHRLDRDTSGVLLAGTTFEALRKLHEAFRTGKIHKEYLAWVSGTWPYSTDIELRHFLRKERKSGKTGIMAHEKILPHAREAVCRVRPMFVANNRSLLQIRLFTGRTHQIRAQLAATGYPVTGDRKYGNDFSHGFLYLHALRIILPDNHEFCCLPQWGGEFQITEMPLPMYSTDIDYVS